MFCEEFPPTFTLPNAITPGFTARTIDPAAPVPVRARDWGEFGAFEVNETFPEESPAVVGANFAVNVAVCPAFTVTGAARPLIEYPVPEADTALIVSAMFPLLDIVTVCDAFPPTATFPKPTELGAKVIWGCPPVPVSGTVAGELGSLLVMVRLPVDAPIASGAYFIVNI
jgi:hypothetical protein